MYIQVMKRFNSLRCRTGVKGMVLFAVATMFGISSCRPDYDLDKRFPEWLGTSIYETLNDGFKNDSTGKVYSFKYFVRLIDDLNQKEILAKTGSKTLFVADDAAFARFLANCPLAGGDSIGYDDLTKAQKTMILNGSMLNNVYQVSMLSSSPGGETTPPILGNCMRRVSASTVLDTIPVLKTADFPKNNKYWDRLRNKTDKGIVLLQDGTNKPIIFFVNKFLTTNNIDADDYDFLFRLGPKYSTKGKPAHKPGDASVNGTTIEWPNKKCFNGFLHVMEEVVYLLPNMAELIASNDSTQIYSSILERFSVPYYSGADKASRDQNVRMLINSGLETSTALADAMNANNDSVYVKKYLSKRARLGTQTVREYQKTNLDNLTPTDNLLKFDPSWNSFVSSTVSSNTDVALQKDMGLMFVPLDDAIMDWWLDESQIGARLRQRYGLAKYKGRNDLTKDEVIEDMSEIPMSVILELVNNNMQYSLIGSVPSKFSAVLNDAQDPFFETKTRDQAEATISDVVMCCNGAVFFTNTIYAPTAYKSVSYPVLVNEKLKIIDWAIRVDEQLAYKAYLNSMVAEYSFFVPLIDTIAGSQFENKLVWIDPASFYLDKESAGAIKLLAFSYGKNSSMEDKVIADVYDYDRFTGVATETGVQLMPESTSNGENDATKFIRNRLLDIMDYHIVLGDVESSTAKDPDGYSYFRTKGRGVVRFKNSTTVGDVANMDLQGGWQIENIDSIDAVQRPIKIIQRVDLSKKTSLTPGNGRTYIIDRPLLPSRRSVYDVLSDTVTYKEFSEFFKLMQMASIFADKSNSNDIASKYCVSTFNSYHYTVYVPKNDGIKALFASKKLMTPSELSAIDTEYELLKLDIEDDYVGDPELKDSTVNAQYTDSLIALSVRLFGVPDTVGAQNAVKKGTNAAYFTNLKLKQLQNFVKYHIQDNSVYVGADFNPGVDDAGNPATVAEYETAYMNASQQFVKLSVKGGSSLTVKDAKNNTRTVQLDKTANGKPYYNIMCREYEVKQITGSTALSDATYKNFSIETSSYAVVHLIDEPLCNGDLDF